MDTCQLNAPGLWSPNSNFGHRLAFQFQACKIWAPVPNSKNFWLQLRNYLVHGKLKTTVLFVQVACSTNKLCLLNGNSNFRLRLQLSKIAWAPALQPWSAHFSKAWYSRVDLCSTFRNLKLSFSDKRFENFSNFLVSLRTVLTVLFTVATGEGYFFKLQLTSEDSNGTRMFKGPSHVDNWKWVLINQTANKWIKDSSGFKSRKINFLKCGPVAFLFNVFCHSVSNFGIGKVSDFYLNCSKSSPQHCCALDSRKRSFVVSEWQNLFPFCEKLCYVFLTREGERLENFRFMFT